MKLHAFRLLLAPALFCSLIQTARAEDPRPAMKIATVDVNRIMNELEEAKAAKKDLEQLSTGARQKLEAQKKTLDALEKKIKDQKLGDDSEEAAKYRKSAREFQAAAGDAEEQIKREFIKVNQSISEKVVSAVERYSKQQGIDLVLDKSVRAGSPVLFGDPAVDITGEVLKTLGK